MDALFVLAPFVVAVSVAFARTASRRVAAVVAAAVGAAGCVAVFLPWRVYAHVHAVGFRSEDWIVVDTWDGRSVGAHAEVVLALLGLATCGAATLAVRDRVPSGRRSVARGVVLAFVGALAGSTFALVGEMPETPVPGDRGEFRAGVGLYVEVLGSFLGVCAAWRLAFGARDARPPPSASSVAAHPARDPWDDGPGSRGHPCATFTSPSPSPPPSASPPAGRASP